MKIRSQILKYMHLDRTYCLLTGRFCCKCSYHVCKRLCQPINVEANIDKKGTTFITLNSTHGILQQSTFPRRKIGLGKEVSIDFLENMSCHSSILFAFKRIRIFKIQVNSYNGGCYRPQDNIQYCNLTRNIALFISIIPDPFLVIIICFRRPWIDLVDSKRIDQTAYIFSNTE